jgi:hypothetical protein
MMSMPEKMRVALRLNEGGVIVVEVDSTSDLVSITDSVYEWAFVPGDWFYRPGELYKDSDKWDWRCLSHSHVICPPPSPRLATDNLKTVLDNNALTIAHLVERIRNLEAKVFYKTPAPKKHMTWPEAAEQLKAGKNVRRASWITTSFPSLVPDVLTGTNHLIYVSDLFADDWVVVE